MQYTLLCQHPDADLFTRLMKVRNIQDNLEDFLDPNFATYRQDPHTLKDMDTALDRVMQAIEKEEKIMIFGDYDVDGIMSSYVIYTFFTKFLNYKNISIRLPHRTRDGYGLKRQHVDDIHAAECTLIITVDNGITSHDEVAYARELGIDVIITDHHQALDTIPEAVAILNPQVSPDMHFKEICGALVAFKYCLALADRYTWDREKKKEAFDRLLPFVAIATVADCMPLVHENRLLVKK